MEQRKTCITGLWLQTRGDRLQVLIERDGQWYVVIDEYAYLPEQTISHEVSALGIDMVVERAQSGAQQATEDV